MRRRTIRCEQCAAVWRRRGTRFCGRCGAAVRPGTAPPRRGVLVAVGPAGVIAAVALIVVAVAWEWPVQPPSVRSGEVGVEPPREAGGFGATLSPEELAQLRRQIDPDRLRCLPRGCERWRYDLADVVDYEAGHGRAAVLTRDGVLTMHAGDEVAWSRRTRAVGDPDDGADAAAALGGGDDGVVVAGNHRVAAFDLTGEELWRRGYGEGDGRALVFEVSVLDEVVVVETASDAEAPRIIRAFDRVRGDPVWEHEVSGVFEAHDVAVLVETGDGDIAVLDPPTGAIRWEQASRAGRAPLVFRGRIAVYDAAGHHLYDADDGTLVRGESREWEPGLADDADAPARQGLEITRTSAGTTITSEGGSVTIWASPLVVVSADPLVVTDHRELIEVRLDPDGG